MGSEVRFQFGGPFEILWTKMKLARRDYEGRSWIKIGDEPTDLVIGVFKLNSDGTDYDYDNPKNFYKRIKTYLYLLKACLYLTISI